MSESIIIGVDHGYAAMKTAHFSFHTGLVAHEHEPYTLNNVLEYGGKYYVVGSGRQPLQKDKTQTEDLGSDTCLKFARTHLFCQHPTKDLYILDILSATLRVSGGLGLLFFQVLQFF